MQTLGYPVHPADSPPRRERLPAWQRPTKDAVHLFNALGDRIQALDGVGYRGFSDKNFGRSVTAINGSIDSHNPGAGTLAELWDSVRRETPPPENLVFQGLGESHSDLTRDFSLRTQGTAVPAFPYLPPLAPPAPSESAKFSWTSYPTPGSPKSTNWEREARSPSRSITGPAYPDPTQSSNAIDILYQESQAAEYNKRLSQNSGHRANYVDDHHWKRFMSRRLCKARATAMQPIHLLHPKVQQHRP